MCRVNDFANGHFLLKVCYVCVSKLLSARMRSTKHKKRKTDQNWGTNNFLFMLFFVFFFCARHKRLSMLLIFSMIVSSFFFGSFFSFSFCALPLRIRLRCMFIPYWINWRTSIALKRYTDQIILRTVLFSFVALKFIMCSPLLNDNLFAFFSILNTLKTWKFE